VKKMLLVLAVLLIPALAKASYAPNETVNFILTLTDAYGSPIPDANCTGYVYYPNMTLYAVLSLQYSNGVYYAQYTTPSVYGTYLETAVCNYTLYGKQRTAFAYSYAYVSQSIDILEERLRQIAENATMNVSVNITGQIENVTNQTLDTLDEIISLMIALHSTPVTEQYCVDENHSMSVKTAQWQVGNRIIPVVKNETEYCEYGCNNQTGACNPAPYIRLSMVTLVILFIIGIVIFIWRFV